MHPLHTHTHAPPLTHTHSNVIKRMLEAAGRGMWNADEATLAALRERFAEMDDELEGVGSSRSSSR